ncbi:MAG: transporter substrate-binding domain-containing protein [Dehalococcoidia bacterium]|nr:transporter substrate-binding domain-containing protein [Dehalococcoidia bacterium]MYH68052.1 transporter substrate-binding domain-containing protein [Dehalococcoidia bacterium]MYK26464.1 transporter substrate-binding domain-containing protein [Dehalococcoidia bacterium]
MRRALGALLLAVASLPFLASCGGAEPVVIATTGDYHPFNFITDEGAIDGFERELGDELCRRAGFECEWVLHEWETLIPDLMAERFDVILAGMSITAEREALLDFTDAYYPPRPSVYLARAGEGEEALGGRLGVTEHTIYSGYLEGQGVAYVPLAGAVDAAGAVLAGQVDAVLVDHGYAVAKLAEHAGRLEAVGPEVRLDGGLGMGVRTGSELLGVFNEALDAMKADGTLNALIRRWLGEEAATFE